jgi:putative Holliday junction resolvase
MSNYNKLSRIIGLDVGKKRIGSALSDELKISTSPFLNFPISGSLDQVIKEILIKCEESNVDTIVIGMPLELDGSCGEQGQFTKKFIIRLIKKIDPNSKESLETLKLNTKILAQKFSIVLIDERFTSIQAENQIKAPKLKNLSRREAKDNISACILVDTYLQMSSLSKT